MSEAKVEYIEKDQPMYLGSQNSSSGWFEEWLYGYYRVDLGDFVMLVPNQYPTPIEDEEYEALLIERAKQTRREQTSGPGWPD